MYFTQLLSWFWPWSRARSLPMKSATKEMRVHPRLSDRLPEIAIHGAGRFPIFNLSMGGLSVNTHSNPALEAVQNGNVLASQLTLDDQNLETDLVVCSRCPEVLGCRFSSLTLPQSRSLLGFLRRRFLGRSLRLIDGISQTRATPGTQVKWYQGDAGTEITYCESTAGNFLWAEISLPGCVISIDDGGRKLRTGCIRTSREYSGPDADAPLGTLYHPTPSQEALLDGRLIIENSGLAEGIKATLLEPIRNQQHIPERKKPVTGQFRLSWA